MATFFKSLSSAVEAVGLLTGGVRQKACPDFADLWWNPDDFGSTFADPAVEFSTEQRRVVLARIGGELRYYAGELDIYDPAYRYEMGIFATLEEALAFAEQFLRSGQSLDEIAALRQVRPAAAATLPTPMTPPVPSNA